MNKFKVGVILWIVGLIAIIIMGFFIHFDLKDTGYMIGVAMTYFGLGLMWRGP